MEYNFKEIEKKWQKYWKDHHIYQVKEDESKPKYYVLDMFPYPSGAGLHVGHPLGYIASDIYSRYKRLKGFNVLHPMGYDAYGLPAEQYAIQTGQHPAITTEKNINRYREQLDKIGFCYDWSREIRTCDPEYYKWTQWAFIQMFNSYYCNDKQQARPIEELVKTFETTGTEGVNAACSEELSFTSEEWNGKSEKEQQEILMNYRIAYLGDTMVNWCPQLGTVLANDEVSEGVSIRGGYPVEQKVMRQWCLRVSAYAQRLLEGLDKIDWTDSLKETQKNWIGRSEGAEMQFKVVDSDVEFTIFTTRADTVFGVTFMVLAPESDYVKQVVTPDQQEAVNKYLDSIKHRTERERLMDKSVTGVFTGAYAVNPLNNKHIPIYISDYVLAGYGTGAIMAVPAHDSRDYAFAKHFDLPIIPLIEGCDVSEESFDAKEGKMINSCDNGLDLNGMEVKEAIAATKKFIKEKGIGRVKVNYRLRDAIFSRQRYWGEPIPLVHCDKCGWVPIPESELPLELPEIETFEPGENGESPLAKAYDWIETTCPCCGGKAQRETDTMPQWAGSSWYFLRYMDPHNDEALASKEALEYWSPVDWYNGGMEHTTLHLLYSRFWHKFLYDIGVVPTKEPYQKRTSHGMILGQNGEKMSKSRGNVVNPDEVVEEFGADAFRTYEMFIGAFDQSTPWSQQGLKGCYKFLERVWNLQSIVNDEEGYSADLEKNINKAIKKVGEDFERMKFNTAIATMMSLVNDFSKKGSVTKDEYKTLITLLNPVAPHMTEELWLTYGNGELLSLQPWPKYDEGKTVDDEIEIVVQINGKIKDKLMIPAGLDKDGTQEAAMNTEKIKGLIEGKNVVKVIAVPGKLVNIVVK